MSHTVSKYLTHMDVEQSFANPLSKEPRGMIPYVKTSLSVRLHLPEKCWSDRKSPESLLAEDGSH